MISPLRHAKIRPAILSGGLGTRLWPSSRKSVPKQFISLPSTRNLFARTGELTAAFSGTAAPIVVSSHQHGFLCRQALAEHQQGAQYKLEVSGRKTAPAICFAAKASDPDDILFVMPSDQWIEETSSFTKTVRRDTTICVFGR